MMEKFKQVVYSRTIQVFSISEGYTVKYGWEIATNIHMGQGQNIELSGELFDEHIGAMNSLVERISERNA